MSSGRSPSHRLSVCVRRCFGERPAARVDFYGYRRQISVTLPKQTKIETCTARLDFGLRESSFQVNTSCSFSHHCFGVCVGRCVGRETAARIDFYGHRRKNSLTRPKRQQIARASGQMGSLTGMRKTAHESDGSRFGNISLGGGKS